MNVVFSFDTISVFPRLSVRVVAMSPEGPSEKRSVFRTGRLEAFSDGVFAIAITLLVLDLTIPQGSEGDLLGGFLDAWPAYLAYVVSFATIGAAWMAHVAITEYVDRSDANFARLNLILLLLVSFLTFPTRLVAVHISNEEAERVAVTILGVNLLLIAVLTYVLWRHAARNSLVRPDVRDDEIQIITRRLTPGLGGYLVLIAVGLFFPLIAVIGYLVLALLLILPTSGRRRTTSTTEDR